MDVILVGIAALTGPIGWLIVAAALIMKHWDPIKTFFSDIWDGIMAVINAAGQVGSRVAGFFGFGGDDDRQGTAQSPARSQVLSPQERTARMIEENRSTSTAEVTIKDDTGRAEVTRGKLGQGLQLATTGAF